MTTYQFAESHNLQTVLWAVAGAAWRMVQMSRQTPTAALHAWVTLYALLLTLWPDLAALVASVAKVTALGMAIVGIVGGLALLMSNPMILVGLALTAGFALATYPRKAVRPSRCPYCKSTDVDAQRGWAECRDCGKSWSY